MTQTTWFLVPVDAQERAGLEARLAETGFMRQGEEYRDAQERVVRIIDAQVQVGIPVSDTVSEHEQLEFLLAVLGLDEDHVQGV